MIQPETAQELSEFLMANDEQQRNLFDEPSVSNSIVLSLFRTRKKPKQQFAVSSMSSTM